MPYIAVRNFPGYLPEEEPVVVDTPAEGWRYHADEREHAEVAWEPEDPNDPDGPQRMNAGQLAIEEMERRNVGGTIYADDYAYSVEWFARGEL
jgi:hypothetical protein